MASDSPQSDVADSPIDATKLDELLELDEQDFIGLLGAMMEHVEQLQNSPPELVAKEDLAADQVVAFLEDHTEANGGPLKMRKIAYVDGRSNVIVEYPGTGTGTKVLSFVGSHLDVVPASPDTWSFDPFKLTREGDKLRGRGVTDCLGHVAMISCLFKALAETRPALERSILAVFIANEEASGVAGVGVDALHEHGELARCAGGPLLWVDSANFGPTLGTGGVQGWTLRGRGKLFHSGLPDQAINAAELVMEAFRVVQTKFYARFPKHASEPEYRFKIASSMKPTRMATPAGGLNQIPGEASISGDVRMTPFYPMDDVKAFLKQTVAEIDVRELPSLGASKFELPAEGLVGSLELEWIGGHYDGVAVDLKSPGFRALDAATVKHSGESRTFSITGSLPLISDLQKAGFDVQVCGYGRMEAYHANDEFGMLSEFEKGFKILASVISQLEVQDRAE